MGVKGHNDIQLLRDKLSCVKRQFVEAIPLPLVRDAIVFATGMSSEFGTIAHLTQAHG
jgi:hypothetical protein